MLIREPTKVEERTPSAEFQTQALTLEADTYFSYLRYTIRISIGGKKFFTPRNHIAISTMLELKN